MKWSSVFEGVKEDFESHRRHLQDALKDPANVSRYDNRLKQDITQNDSDDAFKVSKANKLASRTNSDETEERYNTVKKLWRGIKQKTGEVVDSSPLNKGKNIVSNAIDDTGTAIKKGVTGISRFSEDSIDEIKHQTPKMARMVTRLAEDYPGVAAGAIAAAIAAGLGGLALRNKLKKMKAQQSED